MDAPKCITDDEVGVEPPAQAAVEVLGALDVRDRDDDDLELQIDLPRICGLDCGIRVILSHGHVWLLRILVH